jgi:hypothetical protein
MNFTFAFLPTLNLRPSFLPFYVFIVSQLHCILPLFIILFFVCLFAGACIVGLGEKVAGLFTPDEQLRAALTDAAKRTDESLWSLPLEPAYKESIRGALADLRNIGGKGGGSITAALFLQEFVEKAKWAHIGELGVV